MKKEYIMREANMEELARRIRVWEARKETVPVCQYFMTVTVAAAYFRVHANTIYNWIQDGSIFPHAEKRTDGWMIPYSDIETLKGSGRIKWRKPEEIRPPRKASETDASYCLTMDASLRSPCIYFLLDLSGCVLYVGQTVNVLQRISTHLTKIPGVYSVAIHSFQRDRLDEREQYFILKYQPPYNNVTNSGHRLDGDKTECLPIHNKNRSTNSAVESF